MTHRDHLDEAIDQVSARLIHIERDDELAARIVARLPERPGLFGWLLAGWAPRLAMVALAAIALSVVLRPLDEGVTELLRAENANLPIAELRASVEAEPNSTRPLESWLPVERLEPATVADHEFALPAIEAVAGLSLGSLQPASLPEDAPLTLAPLAIADLPLTADISPRR